jgi:hypothetical protein
MLRDRHQVPAIYPVSQDTMQASFWLSEDSSMECHGIFSELCDVPLKAGQDPSLGCSTLHLP